MSSKEHELVAILFADIVNYTALMQLSESRGKHYLENFQAHLNKIVNAHHGAVVNFYGDGCLAKFHSAEHAVAASRELQIAFRSSDPMIPVRIGIHLGDVFVKDGNIYGNNVNIASRIESFADSGSVLLSEEVYSQLTNKDGFEVRNLGKFNFKNDQKVRTIFALDDERLNTPTRIRVKGKGKKHVDSRIRYGVPALILIAVLSFIFYMAPFTAAKGVAIDRSIAVLPLINLSTAAEDFNYYSNGLTMEIINELAKIDEFNITPFTQSILFKDQNKKTNDIAKELSVSYIMTGSINFSDNGQVKLSVELIDPFKNKILWNQVFLDSLSNAPSFQQEIVQQVADNLKIELSPEEKTSLEMASNVNGEAFRLFLKAKSEMDKYTEKGFSNARDFLDKAIALDSTFAQAYTLKAWSILLSADPLINQATILKHNGVPEADALLKRSLELRPDYSDSYLVRSSINLYARNKIQAAVDDVNYAIKLKSWPRVPTNYCTCTMITTMIAASKFKRATELIQIAEEIDPENILKNWDKGNLELSKNDAIEAEKYFRMAYAENPSEYFRSQLAISLFHQQKYQELIDMYEGVRYSEMNILSHTYLSNAHFKMGAIAKSGEHLYHLQNQMDRGNAHMYLSMIYLARGQNDLALDHFKKAYELNEFGLAVAASTDPIFDVISQDEEFIAIMEEMKG